MTKQTEALKLALEGAANYIDALGGDSRKYRQALAEQPAQQHQEPVYFCDYGCEGWGKVDAAMAAANLADGMTVEAYYTSPQPAQQEPDYKALYEKASQQYNELAALMEQPPAQPEPVQDAEGENKAVRCFLMLYGQAGLTVGQMRKHMAMSGFKSWPTWVETEHDGAHLTKAGAQLWIRHLFALDATPPAAPVQEPVAWYYRFKNRSGWTAWMTTPVGSEKPTNVAFEDMECRPLVFGDTSPPPQRKPLTDDEIGQDPIFRAGVRFAEAAHGIKENT